MDYYEYHGTVIAELISAGMGSKRAMYLASQPSVDEAISTGFFSHLDPSEVAQEIKETSWKHKTEDPNLLNS